MKSIILILGIICSFIDVKAQTSFSIYYNEYCVWNEGNQLYENCKGHQENSLFILNKNETMFTHTTETIKSTYYIKSTEYNKEKEFWLYHVISDVGNKYVYIFDIKNKEIKAVGLNDGKMKLVTFLIKAIF